jgi:ADP-ribose pyrophosphatase
MKHQFEILDEVPVYRGFFNLTRYRLRHSLFRGGWSDAIDRELFHRGRCVAVIPYDPVTDHVVLIEQFRIGALHHLRHPWLLEIVAGAVEPGESPEDVAHREAGEESGCVLKRLIRIFEFYTTPGGCSERLTLFCGLVDARDLGGHWGLAEEQEDILVRVVEFEEAIRLLNAGTIDSAIPIIALQWLALHRAELRAGRLIESR